MTPCYASASVFKIICFDSGSYEILRIKKVNKYERNDIWSRCELWHPLGPENDLVGFLLIVMPLSIFLQVIFLLAAPARKALI